MRSFRRALCAALLACAAAGAAAGPFGSLVILGDSLTDSGNNALALGPDPLQVITGNSYIPTFTYASGTYSDGAVWVTPFAAALGLPVAPSLAGGTNFAFGGAETSFEDANHFPPSLMSQAAMFLGATGGVAPSNGLYVVAGGGNNARRALSAINGGADVQQTIAAAASAYALDIGGIVDQLQAAGAQHIVVWNVPNLGVAPAVAAAGATAVQLGTAVSSFMNLALANELAGEAGVHTFDIFGFVSAAAANPGAFGFANVTDACGAIANCNPAEYLFWDGIHPTSAGGQALIAAGMLQTVAAIPEPSAWLLLLAGGVAIGIVVRAQRSKRA